MTGRSDIVATLSQLRRLLDGLCDGCPRPSRPVPPWTVAQFGLSLAAAALLPFSLGAIKPTRADDGLEMFSPCPREGCSAARSVIEGFDSFVDYFNQVGDALQRQS